MPTTIASLTNQAYTAGDLTLGPWVTPAGNGLTLKIGRSGLPAGLLCILTPYFSFDGGNTWDKEFSAYVFGGTMLEKDGFTVKPFTIVQSPWQKTPAGVPIVPTHIRLDRDVRIDFTAPSILIETM